jgi:anhydro-N-acetylmuramic acid kinase
MDPADGLYVGLISGTSIDGISAALIRRRGTAVDMLAARTSPWPDALRRELTALARAEVGGDPVEVFGRLDRACGDTFAAAALALLAAAGVGAAEVRAIGSHGQTVRHRPRLDPPFTTQLADPNVIAARTGITTVADFRRRDVALGGQGAPLVPPFHAAVFAHRSEYRAVANIGGIANLTLLPPGGGLAGFDSGPGNTLMDAWIRRQRGESQDRGGAWAASGQAAEALLQALVAEPYFDAPPPKSTGFEQFNLEWVETRFPKLHTLGPADVAATFCELSARTIAAALRQHAAGCARLLVCGGGVHNDTLMKRLAHYLPSVSVDSTSTAGVPPDWVEASAFAWLAAQTLSGRPGNDPAVTGAGRASLLGGIFPA